MCTCSNLVKDPGSSLGEALLEGGGRCPSNDLLDQVVVAVPAAHTLGSWNVVDEHAALAAQAT